MRRVLLVLAVLLVAGVALPPLYFRAYPEDPPRLPPADRRVEVADGVFVNVVERGRGPSVVLVHGLPGMATDWGPLHEALAERSLRVIAYDRVGFGRSDGRPDDDYTVEANARELLGLLEGMDLRAATVVGWSYGGATAMQAALDDPTRIASLVLVGSAGPEEEPREPPAWAAVIFSEPVLRWVAAVPPVSRSVQAAISEQAFSGQEQPAWWATQLEANFAAPHTRRAWRREGALFDVQDLDPGPIPRPVLVIHGQEDRLAPPAIGEWILAHTRDARILRVEGGSHMLPITHPELLADRIERFVRRGE